MNVFNCWPLCPRPSPPQLPELGAAGGSRPGAWEAFAAPRAGTVMLRSKGSLHNGDGGTVLSQCDASALSDALFANDRRRDEAPVRFDEKLLREAAAAEVAALQVAQTKGEGRQKRAKLTPEERSRINRDRNREHARNTRLRKKAYMNKLKELVKVLTQERERLDRECRQTQLRSTEQADVRARVIRKFLDYRSSRQSDRSKWQSIVDPNVTLTTPSLSISGIEDVADESSDDCREVAIDEDSVYQANDALMCRWECPKGSAGMLQARFTPQNRLSSVELFHDAFAKVKEESPAAREDPSPDAAAPLVLPLRMLMESVKGGRAAVLDVARGGGAGLRRLKVYPLGEDEGASDGGGGEAEGEGPPRARATHFLGALEEVQGAAKLARKDLPAKRRQRKEEKAAGSGAGGKRHRKAVNGGGVVINNTRQLLFSQLPTALGISLHDVQEAAREEDEKADQS